VTPSESTSPNSFSRIEITRWIEAGPSLARGKTRNALSEFASYSMLQLVAAGFGRSVVAADATFSAGAAWTEGAAVSGTATATVMPR
jgi:hypothetical protein